MKMRYVRGSAVRSSESAVFAAKVTGLASLRLVLVARGRLSALVGVQMSASGSAVAISRDWLLVDVVHCDMVRMAHSDISDSDSLKGPPSAGRPEKETAKLTPLPSEAVVPVMDPWTLLLFKGRVAT